MKASGIGGQAVMEGIMMKNGENYAVAVRKPDNEIVVKQDVDHSYRRHEKIRKIPFIRGVFNFIDSLVLGMSTLTYSAEFYEEEEEPSKFDLFLTRILGGFGEKVIKGGTIALSIIFAVVIFMICPFLLAKLFERFIVSQLVLSLVEGLIRVGILLGYIGLISRIEDIQRVFMYHGAEHKCINCIEQGLELNVENVMKSSKEHKRCGTSFLLVVMFVSIIFFLFIRVDTTWMRLGLRILLVPVIAGVSYEFIRLAGNTESKIMDILSKPGLLLQGLTTREPDESMVEVAIKAVEAVFDWKAFLEEYKVENGIQGIRKPANKSENANVAKAINKSKNTSVTKNNTKSIEKNENQRKNTRKNKNGKNTFVDKSIESESMTSQVMAVENVAGKSEAEVATKVADVKDNVKLPTDVEAGVKVEAKTETDEFDNVTAKEKTANTNIAENVVTKNTDVSSDITTNIEKEVTDTSSDITANIEKKETDVSGDIATNGKTADTNALTQEEEATIPEYIQREKKETETKSVTTSPVEEDLTIKAPRLTFVDDSEPGVIKLHWDKVKKVSGYVIYRKTDDEVYKMYPEVKKNYFEDREVEKGATYYYRVRAYVIKNNKRIYGQMSLVESNGFNARVKSKY